MIERIDGPECELDIAFWVDIVCNAQDHFADVLHVAVFIHHDYALGEHRLTQGPDGVHHLACVAGVTLLDRNKHEVMEDTFDGKIDVNNLRNGHLHCGQEDTLDSLTHPRIFHRWLADDGCGVDGIFPMRDAGEMEDGIFVRHSVEAGVVAEWAFAA